MVAALRASNKDVFACHGYPYLATESGDDGRTDTGGAINPMWHGSFVTSHRIKRESHNQNRGVVGEPNIPREICNAFKDMVHQSVRRQRMSVSNQSRQTFHPKFFSP